MFGAHLAFANPGLLGFLAALPLLWWLLRLTPPAAKKIFFPALELLRHAAKTEQTPARTPWWLLLLRLLVAALIIAALAGPVVNPQATVSGKGPLLIAVDNDWAAARNWDARQDMLHELLRAAARNNREVLLLPTAPPASGEAQRIKGPMAAKAALIESDQIKPQPWPADWQGTAKLVQNLPPRSFADAIWLSSGLGGIDAGIFYKALQGAGNVLVFADENAPVYLLKPPQSDNGETQLALLRARTDSAANVSAVALDRDGQPLAHIAFQFPSGEPRATAPLKLPLDLRNQVARFELEGPRTAATTVLLDASWEHRPIGIVGDKNELDRRSLLSGMFYIDRALEPYAAIHIGNLGDLLKQPMAVLVVPGNMDIGADDIAALTDWVKKGGVLVLFAGDHLSAESGDENGLLPVPLRSGDRAMGGTLSWSVPQKLQAFPANSPFRGLAAPQDVTVSRQLLAEPSEDLPAHTWAALADGTPLVTAKNLGQGLTILFHVPASSGWSNLPLSGLFVDMLRRIVDLSRGAAGGANFASLPPLTALNAFGEEEKPGAAAMPIDSADMTHLAPGPQHPPGLYGSDALNRAFNLGAALAQPEALKNIPAEPYRAEAGQTDLQSDLLAAALLLLLLDFGISLYMRGLLLAKRKAAA